MRILLIAAAVAAAGAAYAQSTPTTITGLVRDTSGAVIPGANVRVVSEESGVAVGATTNSAVPVRTVAELIALAKAKPGTLSYASCGNGTPQHLAGELHEAVRANEHALGGRRLRGPQWRDEGEDQEEERAEVHEWTFADAWDLTDGSLGIARGLR